jgi:hypothetical protein
MCALDLTMEALSSYARLRDHAAALPNRSASTPKARNPSTRSRHQPAPKRGAPFRVAFLEAALLFVESSPCRLANISLANACGFLGER